MELTLLPLIDDQKCFESVRKLRWPEAVTCPHCESPQVTKRGLDETQPCRQRYHCGVADTTSMTSPTPFLRAIISRCECGCCACISWG